MTSLFLKSALKMPFPHSVIGQMRADVLFLPRSKCRAGETVCCREALEAYRNHEPSVHISTDSKPEGMVVELIDCIIGILDYLAYTGIDVDSVLRIKMNYNETRPYRHGEKEL